MGKKVASAVSIIGGADGPTSVFLVGGKGAKRTLKQRIQRKLFRLRKWCIARCLKANPHTMEQVIEYAKSKWGYGDADKNTEEYKREYKEMRVSLILQYKPELLGKLKEFPQLERRDADSVKRFLEEMEQRQQAAQEVSVELFDIDLCVLEKKKGNFQAKLIFEKKYGYIGASASGRAKREMKKHNREFRDVYRYYGVSQADIDNRTKRYEDVVGTLAQK